MFVLVHVAVMVLFLRLTQVSGNGCSQANYNGSLSVTNGGRICQRWADQDPHVHKYNENKYFPLDESVEDAENFCRPVEDSVAWCYTNDVYKRWDYCNDRICEDNGCGGTLENDEGTFTTPDRDRNGKYEPSRDCLWTITASAGTVIELVFQSFDIEADLVCAYDFVQIYDDSIPHGIYCGETMPPLIRSSGQVLYVRFYSDPGMERAGFDATFSQVLPGNDTVMPNNVVGILTCPVDADIMLYNGTVAINNDGNNCLDWSVTTFGNEQFFIDGSKQLAKNYCRNIASVSVPWCVAPDFTAQSCIYQICKVSDPGCSRVNYSGNVSITNGGRTCQRWADQFPHVHEYTTNDVFPLDESMEAAENFCRPLFDDLPWCFTTDVYRRWDYCHEKICEDLDSCGGALESSEGTFSSPDRDGNGKYDSQKDCLWTITAPQGKIIELIFQSFDLEPDRICSYDFLQVFDDTVPHGIYCGKALPPTIRSNGPVLYVRFYSDDAEEWKGFQANYSQVVAGTVTTMPARNVIGSLTCPLDVDIFRYSGTVALNDYGETCLPWKDTPVIDGSSFLVDGSKEQAKNYCRNIGKVSLPWCYVEGMSWNYCIVQICGGKASDSTTLAHTTTTGHSTKEDHVTTEAHSTSEANGATATHATTEAREDRFDINVTGTSYNTTNFDNNSAKKSTSATAGSNSTMSSTTISNESGCQGARVIFITTLFLPLVTRIMFTL